MANVLVNKRVIILSSVLFVLSFILTLFVSSSWAANGTLFFDDGFEVASTGYEKTGWGTPTTGTGCTFSPATAIVADTNGNYRVGMYDQMLDASTMNRSAGNYDAYNLITGAVSHPSLTIAYYFNLKQVGSGFSTSMSPRSLIVLNNSNQAHCAIEHYTSDGTNFYLRSKYWDSGGNSHTQGSYAISNNTLYLIELRCDHTNDRIDWQVNGVAQTGADTTFRTGDPQKTIVGIYTASTTASPHEVYIDRLRVSDGTKNDLWISDSTFTPAYDDCVLDACSTNNTHAKNYCQSGGGSPVSKYCYCNNRSQADWGVQTRWDGSAYNICGISSNGGDGVFPNWGSTFAASYNKYACEYTQDYQVLSTQVSGLLGYIQATSTSDKDNVLRSPTVASPTPGSRVDSYNDMYRVSGASGGDPDYTMVKADNSSRHIQIINTVRIPNAFADQKNTNCYNSGGDCTPGNIGYCCNDANAIFYVILPPFFDKNRASKYPIIIKTLGSGETPIQNLYSTQFTNGITDNIYMRGFLQIIAQSQLAQTPNNTGCADPPTPNNTTCTGSGVIGIISNSGGQVSRALNDEYFDAMDKLLTWFNSTFNNIADRDNIAVFGGSRGGVDGMMLTGRGKPGGSYNWTIRGLFAASAATAASDELLDEASTQPSLIAGTQIDDFLGWEYFPDVYKGKRGWLYSALYPHGDVCKSPWQTDYACAALPLVNTADKEDANAASAIGFCNTSTHCNEHFGEYHGFCTGYHTPYLCCTGNNAGNCPKSIVMGIGTQDATVSFQSQLNFDGALRDANIPHKAYIVWRGGHGAETSYLVLQDFLTYVKRQNAGLAPLTQYAQERDYWKANQTTHAYADLVHSSNERTDGTTLPLTVIVPAHLDKRIRYQTDFTEYSTGSAPGDWFIIGQGSGTILDDGSGHNSLRLMSDANYSERGERFSGYTDADIKLECKSSTATGETCGALARNYGDYSSHQFFSCNLGNGVLQIVKRTPYSQLATYNYSWALNTYYWIRFKVEGDSLKCKIWAADDTNYPHGENEPPNWNIDITNSSIPSYSGVGVEHFTTYGYSYFKNFTALPTNYSGSHPYINKQEPAEIVIMGANSGSFVVQQTDRNGNFVQEWSGMIGQPTGTHCTSGHLCSDGTPFTFARYSNEWGTITNSSCTDCMKLVTDSGYGACSLPPCWYHWNIWFGGQQIPSNNTPFICTSGSECSGGYVIAYTKVNDFQATGPEMLKDMQSGYGSYSAFNLNMGVSQNPPAFRSLSDSITLTDSLSKKPTKPFSDSITFSDGKISGFGKASSDSITFSDSLGTKGIGHNQSDNLTLSDSISKITGKPLSDIISLIDSPYRSAGKSASDTVILSDSFGYSIGFLRTVSDTLTLTDAIAKSIGKNLSDTITFSDAFNKVSAFYKNFSDTVTLSDSLSFQVALLLVDTLTLTDEIYRTLNPGTFHWELPLHDIIVLADSISSKTIGKSLADSIVLVDSRMKAIGKASSDSIAFSDSLGKTIHKNPSDAITFSDSLAMQIVLNMADSLTLIDEITTELNTPAHNWKLELNDDISFSDLFIKAAGKILSDSITLSEVIKKGMMKSLMDNLTLLDSLSRTVMFYRTLNDILSLSEQLVIGQLGVVLGIEVPPRFFGSDVAKRIFGDDVESRTFGTTVPARAR